MSATRLLTTTRGPARLYEAGSTGDPAGLLVLGHGAGGDSEAPDLIAAAGAAVALGWRVVRMDQPWRVAGRRVAEA
ncbi:MAG: alpha/beta hydrolase, partial [Mycobacteriales bacterium]